MKHCCTRNLASFYNRCLILPVFILTAMESGQPIYGNDERLHTNGRWIHVWIALA